MSVSARQVLQAFDIGDDVAEFDERLSSYFVETSSFQDIVTDKADLILGAKGSGKSAIFKHLANSDAGIPQLDDVDIIPAFNIQGSVIFRRLSDGPSVSEPAYRFIWFTYIVAMISNHLLSSYSDIIDLSRLAELIDAADLRVGPPFPRRLWDKIETLINSISGRLELEGELEFGIPKLPIKAKGRGRLRPRNLDSDSSDSQVDLEEVLLICGDHLARLKRRCWLVFDRLDEAFEHSRDLENIVLRGLMRAHLDVASYGSSIRTKLFLRNDIMDRMMRRQGFVNATHLRRLHLEWDSDAIIDLLARRIASNLEVRDAFDIKPGHLKSGQGRLNICHHVLPSYVYSADLPEWLARFTTDSSRSLNPRNVLTLVRLARQQQLDVYDRDDPELTSVPSLISASAVMIGFRRLSEVRLEDTVYAEFNSLRSVVDSLRGKPVRFTSKELAGYIKSGRGSERFKSSLEMLEYAGVIWVSSQDNIIVAQLYRPALGTAISRRLAVTLEDKTSLESRIDAAMENAPQEGLPVELPDMSDPERRLTHHYIRQKYPDYSTTSVTSASSPRRKTLIIHKREANSPHRIRLTRQAKNLQYFDPSDVDLLLRFRASAAEIDGFFIAPPLEYSLALTLVEIDRLLRKNKQRRRIVAYLTDPSSVESLLSGDARVQLILGSCHARIIDPMFHQENVADLQEAVVELMNGLCGIARDADCLVVVTFSCLAVKVLAKPIVERYPAVEGLELPEEIPYSSLAVMLQSR